MVMQGTIRYDVRDGIAELTIDNETRRNAMSLSMWRSLPELVARADRDHAVRAIVLQGAGDKAFCSGADISQFGEVRSGETAVAAYDAVVAEGSRSLKHAAKPSIAVIRGICFGGGVGLAMTCDIRLARDDARFRVPAARLGLGYGYEGVRTFVQRIGYAATADLFVSGRVVEAPEAERLTIANRVWPEDRFEQEVSAYLGQVGRNAPLTLKAAKAALSELARPEADQNPEAVAALVAACFASEDYREGQAAFREKREPVFRGV